MIPPGPLAGRAVDETGVTAHGFAPALDDVVQLDGAAAHHWARVRRLRVGEAVTLARDDGSGDWRRYDVARVERSAVELRAIGPLTHEPEAQPAIVVAIATVAPARFERAIAPLSELGVATVVPLVAQRCSVDAPALRRDRLVRLARESAEQCRRTRPLVIADALDSRSLLAVPGCVLVDARGASIDEARAARPAGEPWLLATGPEGGWTDAERAAHAAGGGPALRLGAYVLRAETAPIAAAAAVVATEPARRA